MYVNLQSESTSCPAVSSHVIGLFCQKCKLMDKDFNLSTSDRLFIASTVKLEKEVANKGSLSDEKTMVINDMLRFEFIELLVRIAKLKYIDTGIHERYYNALEELFETDLRNYEQHMHPLSETYWRRGELYTLEINDCLHANLEGLK